MLYQGEKDFLYHILKNDVVNLLKKYNTVIAGGCITSIFCNREIHDIDIYFHSNKDFFLFVKECIEEYGGHILYISKKAVTIGGMVIKDFGSYNENTKINLQCIAIDFVDSIDDIFNFFDFTVCMGAFDFSTEEFVLHEQFLLDNAKKQLVVNPKTKYPISTLFRVNKYKDYGYNISNKEYLKIIIAIHSIKCNSWEEFEEQIGNGYQKIVDLNINDQEFSWDAALSILNTINGFNVVNNDNSVDYLAMSSSKQLELISDICGYKVDVIIISESNSNIMILQDENIIIKPKSYINKFMNVVHAEHKTMYLYKFVQRDGESYKLYNMSYKFNVGENIECPTSYYPYQYVYKSDFASRCDRVLCKFMVNTDNIVVGKSNSNYIHCTESKMCEVIHDISQDGLLPMDEDFFDED